MKSLIIYSLAAILVSCNAQRHINTDGTNKNSSHLKSELYFNNCDSTLAFFKAIIINSNSDKTLKAGRFRIPYINSSYEYTKSLFPEKCFIGISDEELKSIFGQGIREGDFATWYVMQNINNRLAIEVWIREGVVEKFKVGASTVESINPTNKNR